MKYLILILCTLVISCRHNVPDFPSEYVYYFEHGSAYCVRFEIVSQDPIKLGKPETMSRPECPAGIIGIDAESTPAVRDWIRVMQKSLKSCK